jgi:hypothetical protein
MYRGAKGQKAQQQSYFIHIARAVKVKGPQPATHDISRIFRSSLSHFCATFREARRLVGVRADMPAASLGAP